MKILGKGRAAAVGDDDLARLAIDLGCHPAVLEAISIVESAGFGWSRDGRMKILFEKHWFYKLLKGAQLNRAVKLGLARKGWVSPARGGYKEQKTTAAKYKILEQAISINEEAAFKSISMGKYQIMGFNHKICGFSSAKDMFYEFADSEVNQLRAFSNFLVKKNLQNALRNEDFNRIEKVYNGGGLGGKYAARMRTHCKKLKAGKWKNFNTKASIAPAPKTETKSKPAQNPKNKAIAVAVGTATVATYTWWDKVQAFFAGLLPW